MSNIHIYDDLIAYRLSLLDDNLSENEIISELKDYLARDNNDNDNIVMMLYEFYQYIDVDISYDMIQNNESSQELVNNTVAEILRMPIIQSLFRFNQPNNNQFVQPMFNFNEPEQQAGEEEHEEEEAEPFVFAGGQINQPIFNPVLILNNNIFNYPVNPPVVIEQNEFVHNPMLNVLNMLISGINNNEVTDVKVSTSDDDIEKLEVVTLDKKLEDNCTICMDNMNINDEVIILQCKHTYHKKCIVENIDELRNRCPVCRHDIGKSKHII
jgi:hypothetical protein